MINFHHIFFAVFDFGYAAGKTPTGVASALPYPPQVQAQNKVSVK